jgi:hypothetical protein
LVEWLLFLHVEACGNPDRIEGNAIAPGIGIHPIEIADPLRLDAGGDRLAGDRSDTRLHGTPFGRHLAIANDIECPLSFRAKLFVDILR